MRKFNEIRRHYCKLSCNTIDLIQITFLSLFQFLLPSQFCCHLPIKVDRQLPTGKALQTFVYQIVNKIQKAIDFVILWQNGGNTKKEKKTLVKGDKW